MRKLSVSLFIMKTFKDIVIAEKKKAYFQDLRNFLKEEYATKNIYPPQKQVLRSLALFELKDLKVVIIGQDPYHERGQANGLAFSVNPGVRIPPSLQNMYKELEDDLGIPAANNGDLTAWAKQGVLLLNNVLTVQEGRANSHKDHGWEIFTENVIKEIAQLDQPIVFILWGRNAQSKEKIIGNKHYIIKSNHPSPLSAYRGFFGSRPFSRTNAYLKSKGLKEIDWKIDDV